MAVNPSTTTWCNSEPESVLTKNSHTTIKVNNNDAGHEQKHKLVKNIQPIIVELIGTMFFILIGLLGTCTDQNNGSSLQPAFAFGFSLMICAASFGHMSGAHFNPAVTLAVLIAGAIELKMAALYIVMQLIGGILGAGVFRLLAHETVYHYCRGGATFLVTIRIPKGFDTFIIDRVEWWEGVAIELLLTFVFVTVILLLTLDTKSKTNFAPIYIGFSLSVCILASNSLTGASLNPARSLGPAIYANVWAHHYIYWIGPILGGMLAGGFYRILWKVDDH